MFTLRTLLFIWQGNVAYKTIKLLKPNVCMKPCNNLYIYMQELLLFNIISAVFNVNNFHQAVNMWCILKLCGPGPPKMFHAIVVIILHV